MKLKFLPFLIFVAYFSLGFGITDEIKELLLKFNNMNRNKTEICLEYFQLQPINPCEYLKEEIVELKSFGTGKISLISTIETGDTDEKIGYRLIVNETLTVDIPAVIKCDPKYKNSNKTIEINGKEYIYYLIMYLKYDYQFEKLLISESKEENKTVFALQDAALMFYIREYYQFSNSEQRKPIVKWFNKHSSAKIAKQECEHLSTFGKLTEDERPVSWKILSGKLDVAAFMLRVTETMEVRVRGLIQCNVQVQESKDAKPIIKKRYFFMAKPDPNPLDHVFTVIYGPITVKNRTERTFALKEEFLK